MFYFFLNIAMISLLSVSAVMVMLWFRRRFGTETLRRNHEVAGCVYSVVGAIFAVTVALVVDTVHDEYRTAEKFAATEAIQVASIYQLAGWFPGNGEIRLKSQLRQYATGVIEKEWARANQAGEPSDAETEAVFRDIVTSVRTLTPTTIQQQTAYGEMIHRLSGLREYRYNRLYGKQSELPFPLWFAVVFGGMITIGFSLFFSMDSPKAQMVLIFFVSALIWSNIMVISQVHYPFNGIDITPPRPFIDWLART
jgi:hypothetical protein